MRKTVGFLFALAILSQPITVQANGLSYFPTEEETGIPTDIMEYAEIIGHQYNICPELLLSIAYQESRFIANVENGPCKGIMQINAELHKDRFSEAGWDYTDWSNAYKNIYVAADYLAELFEEYEDVGIVLGVYHGESKAVENGMNGNLSSYTTKILEKSEELERLHGR